MTSWRSRRRKKSRPQVGPGSRLPSGHRNRLSAALAATPPTQNSATTTTTASLSPATSARPAAAIGPKVALSATSPLAVAAGKARSPSRRWRLHRGLASPPTQRTACRPTRLAVPPQVSISFMASPPPWNSSSAASPSPDCIATQQVLLTSSSPLETSPLLLHLPLQLHLSVLLLILQQTQVL